MITIKIINIIDTMALYFFAINLILPTASVVEWSEFLATDQEARFRFPALPEKKVVSLERGPLSLVSTTEELLDRKVAAPL
jgi:predicted transglutaminase-like protease